MYDATVSMKWPISFNKILQSMIVEEKKTRNKQHDCEQRELIMIPFNLLHKIAVVP